jgi:ABC-type uncharacterized transport system substrate-binding protein
MLNTAKFKEPFAVVGNPIGPIASAMDAAFNMLSGAGKSVVKSPLSPGTTVASFINGLKGYNIKTLYVCSDMFVTSIAKDLADAARKENMKTMWEFAEHKAKHGGDAAYGVDFPDLFKQAADAVAEILKGKVAGEIGIWTAADGPAP